MYINTVITGRTGHTLASSNISNSTFRRLSFIEIGHIVYPESRAIRMKDSVNIVGKRKAKAGNVPC
jgi:hypothetical protein